MFDWLLYPRKLREAIAGLKSKGDFRPEGLGRLHKILFWLVFCAVILIALTLTITLSGTHPDPDIEYKAKIITVSTVVFTSIACILARNNVFNNWIVSYSFGKTIIACVVESKFNYISSSSGSTIGWNIKYKYYLDDEKYIGVGRFISSNALKRIPKANEEIEILYDEKNPNVSNVYVDYHIAHNCISLQKYAELTNSGKRKI